MDSRYAQLARRMVLTALAVALVPLWLLGGAIFHYFAAVQRSELKGQLRSLATNRANAIQLYLTERTAMLETLVHAYTLDQLTQPGELQRVLRLVNRRTSSFIDLGVIDTRGAHLAYAGPYPLEHADYGDAPWFQETMVRGVHVSDVFLGVRGVPHFVAAVKNQEGPEPWVLRATIDSEVFTRLVQGVQLGPRGDAYIVSRDGLYQTPPRFTGDLLGRTDLDIAVVPPGTEVFERRDGSGRRLLTASAWLPGKDWLLVIDQDPRQARGPLRIARSLEVAVLVVGTIMILAVVQFLVRLLVRELEAQDRSRASLEAQLAHTARLASLGRMAAGVAHEVNNPLAAIGELAGLMEDLIDPEFVRSNPHGGLFADNVRKIQEHVDRAREVTHRLLGFARRMEPRQDTVNINQVVEEALQFVEREAVFENIQLARDLDPDMPLIRSDRAQLQQVFLNVLDNAIDAVSPGGRVVVTSRVVGNTVEVAIADDGPGIPIEHQGSVFDPFFTTKEPGEGTGLGLSISHSIMQQLGGSLECESRPGHGTTFFVRLPSGGV